MRIVHLLPPGVHPFSGVLTSIAGLATALARRGHEVELWQVGEWPTGAHELEARIGDAGICRRRFERGASAARRIANEADGLPAAVMHLHGVFQPFNIRLTRRVTLPYVLSPHGGYAPASLAHHALRKLAFRVSFELPMLRRAAAVCALTSAEARDIRRFGVHGTIPVVPNGVDPRPEITQPGGFRRDLGVMSHQRLAVYVGRIDVPAKRLDRLILSLLGSPAWHLALIGGDFRGGLEKARRLIAASGLTGRVHAVGPRRGLALHEALGDADLFVLPSRSEGLPMALLEAASHGVPALVSLEVDRCIPVTAAGAGWASDAASLTQVLHDIDSASAEEWDSRGAAARRLAQRYGWNEAAARCERVYAAALAIGAPGSVATRERQQ